MDPLAIFGGVGAAAGLIGIITKTVRHLSDLQTKYAESEMSIRQLIRQLMSIKASLSQIQEWTELNLSRAPRERELAEAFEISFEGCKEAMDAMADEVARLAQDAVAGDKRTMRMRYVWNEEAMKDHQGRLDRQVQALQLLLSAVQCRTSSEQTALLREPKSRQIVERIRDDTSSLRASSTRGSITRPLSTVSHSNYTIGHTEFEMDRSILKTDVYRRAAMKDQRVNSANEQRLFHASSDPSTPDGTGKLSSPPSIYSERPESSDRISLFNRRPDKPKPYERSVASDPIGNARYSRRPQVPVASVSDSFLPAFTTPLRSKTMKKRSFLPSIFTGSSRTLLSPSPQDQTRASNHRRGRRHPDQDIYRSIDLNTSDGRNAPPLVHAAQSGSGYEIEELLDQGMDIEARHDGTKRTALAVASHCGNDDVVAILLQHQASPNAKDAFDMAPLHLAATRGHYRIIEHLLKEGVDVDAPGPEKKTALRLAADNGHVEVVDLLLSHRAKVNLRDAHNITALHSAASLGDEDIVELLIKYKADIEAKDSNFQAAIHHASEKDRDRVVEILLSKKADIEAVGKESMSPLIAACAAGSTEVVKLLLQRKASTKHKAEGGMTSLHWASYNGHSDVVDILLEKRVSPDPRTNDGRTPLHLAVMANNFAVADLLLRRGAAVDTPCQNFLRPLHYAASSDKSVVQLLLGHGAALETETSTGKRPLHYATSEGNTEMIGLLLQKGAFIDARDGAGDRPLCIASTLGNVEAVRLLLDRGAQKRARYAKGPSHEDSPLCIAAKNGHLSVVQELVQRGVSIRQKDETNWQPLRYAAYYGHPEIVQYLLACGASVSSFDNPGSFGFNITASRIGFAPNANIDEFRRQSVLMLLLDAQVREQESRDNPRRYPSVRSPRQDLPAEKADDTDNRDENTLGPQELMGHQKWPQGPPAQYIGYKPTIEPRDTETPPNPSTPPQPRSPPTFSQTTQLTLDPNLFSVPQQDTVDPPSMYELPSHARGSELRGSPIMTPSFPSQPTAISESEAPISPERSPSTRSKPPSPDGRPVSVIITHPGGDDVGSSTSNSPPQAPARAPPVPPNVPTVTDPNEVVCDICRVANRTTIDLSCAGCRKALFMYHFMSDESPNNAVAVKLSQDRTKPAQPIYELA